MRPDHDEPDVDEDEDSDDEADEADDELEDEDEDDELEDDDEDGGDDAFEESDYVEGSTFALGVAVSDSRRWDPCSVAVRANAEEGVFRALIDASIEQHEDEGDLEDAQTALTLAHELIVAHIESSFAVEDDPPSWELCVVEVDAQTFRRRNEFGLEELRVLPGAVVEELPGDEEDDEDEELDDDDEG